MDVDAAKLFVFTIGNRVNDVTLSQSGCESHEDGGVMFGNGASVNVCPRWFGESALEQSDGTVRLWSADGRTLKEYGKRQIQLSKQYEFHVAESCDKTDPEC